MPLLSERRATPFRKEEFVIQYHFYRCVDTGEQFTDTNLDTLNLAQVHNQYRERHGIPYVDEICSIRESYGLSAARMSDILGFGTNGWRLYEQGEVPSISNGRLIRRASHPKAFFAMAEESGVMEQRHLLALEKKVEHLIGLRQNADWVERWLQELEPGATTGFRKPDARCFAAMVRYFAAQIRPWKVQLNKLLYFADFRHFQKTGVSISGLPYVAIDLGPVPDRFHSLFEWVERRGYVDVRRKEFSSGGIGEQFHASSTELDVQAILGETELATLQETLKTYGHLNTQDIIDLSHEEPAWKAFKDRKNERISFQEWAWNLPAKDKPTKDYP